jgi:hypothetical protein
MADLPFRREETVSICRIKHQFKNNIKMRIHKTVAITLFVSTLIFLQAESVFAQADTGNGGNLGVGFMVGEPTGVSVKAWNNDRSAFVIGAAWSLGGRHEALHMHLDYLQHSWFKDVDEGSLGFYYGLGGRAIFTKDAMFGIRIPLGLTYVFGSIPFDIFVEAVPILDLTPDTEFAGNGAIGLRYYF